MEKETFTLLVFCRIFNLSYSTPHNKLKIPETHILNLFDYNWDDNSKGMNPASFCNAIKGVGQLNTRLRYINIDNNNAAINLINGLDKKTLEYIYRFVTHNPTDDKEIYDIAFYILQAAMSPMKSEHEASIMYSEEYIDSFRNPRLRDCHYISDEALLHLQNLSPETENTESFNFDDCLDEKFHELFDIPKNGGDDEVKSNLIDLVNSKKKQAYVDDFFNRNSSSNDVSETSSKKLYKSLIPIHKKNMCREGKRFFITDKPGDKTLVFEIYDCIDSFQNLRYLEAELLNSDEQVLEDMQVQRTFYIEDPQEDGNRLLFITLSKNDKCCILFDGLLMENEIHISKSLMYLKMRPKSNKNNYVFNGSCYDLSNLTESQMIRLSEGQKECELSARLDSNALVIDTVSQNLVTRTVYYDEIDHDCKAKIKLYTNRDYLLINVYSNPHRKKYDILSNVEIGRYYSKGWRGYQKDIVQALSYLEKEKFSMADYYISQIFFDELELYDFKLGLMYLVNSVKRGCIDAIAEYISLDICGKIDVDNIDNVFENCDFKDQVVIFLEAAFYELHNFGNFDDIFDLYYRSAQLGFKPAQYRISDYHNRNIELWNKFITKEKALNYFANSINTDNGEKEFCIGSVLLYGWGIESTERTENAGVLLLQQAISKGNINSVYELFDYYLTSDESEKLCKIKDCALILIDILNDAKELNELANYLLDMQNSTYETDEIAIKALEKAINLNCQNSVYINNLAWTYLKGRGTNKNFSMAYELFQKSFSLGSASSAKHLGSMYENGLGVTCDIEEAKKYYKVGAERGNQFCVDKLNNL